MSPSEVNHALKRLACAKLFNPLQKAILKQSALEFLLFGLKYVFPGELGPRKAGVPTAHSVLSDEIRFDPADLYVWPSQGGSERGQSLKPLFASVPAAALNDKMLHRLLALLDVLRVGQTREINLAKKHLSNAFLSNV